MGIFIVCFIIWIISVLVVCDIYSKKNVTPSIWSVSFLLLPIINTVIALIFFPKSVCGLKKFIRELKEG